MTRIILLFTLMSFSLPLMAADMRGRLGVGMSNQLNNDLPAISLKIQQSKVFAIGGLLGFKSDDDHTLYGAGLRFYRLIFDEPQLNFYMAGTFASLSYLDDKDKEKTGYQIDGTLGSEFHFTGLESLGFSFEFGFSVNDVGNGTTFETLGNNFLKAAVHFYL
ncbi:MAG: hypothetical protein ACOVP4_08175 [Bacteriovoracaceae bacterium]